MLTTAQVSGGAFGQLIITDNTLAGTHPLLSTVASSAPDSVAQLAAFLTNPSSERAVICGKVGRTTLCNGLPVATATLHQVCTSCSRTLLRCVVGILIVGHKPHIHE